MVCCCINCFYDNQWRKKLMTFIELGCLGLGKISECSDICCCIIVSMMSPNSIRSDWLIVCFVPVVTITICICCCSTCLLHLLLLSHVAACLIYLHLAPASCPLLTASALFVFCILLLYNAATAAAATEFEEDKIIVKPKMQEEEEEEATTNVNRERETQP